MGKKHKKSSAPSTAATTAAASKHKNRNSNDGKNQWKRVDIGDDDENYDDDAQGFEDCETFDLEELTGNFDLRRTFSCDKLIYIYIYIYIYHLNACVVVVEYTIEQDKFGGRVLK